MRKRCLMSIAALAAALLPVALSAGPGAPASRPAAARLRVDRDQRQIIVPTVVQLQEGQLEFFLCSKGAKDHETVLTTTVRPAALHAALLSFDLAPGRPGRWGVPPAGGDAVFISPAGATVELALRWTDGAGKVHTVPAVDWLTQGGKKIKRGDLKWVFVGSDFLDDDRYWADVEGMFISLANFPAAVIDVPFKSSSKTAFLEFACAAKVIPAQGTQVDLIITVPKEQAKAPDARIGFTVDAFGRIRLDGVPIAPEAIPPAVKKFLASHARGAAEVRLDSRALIHDRDRLELLLNDVGLTNVTFRTKGLRSALLPRGPAEAAKTLKWWANQLAQSKDMLIDPGDDIEDLLKHVERRRREIDATTALWDDYAARLRVMLKAHRKKNPKPAPDTP